MPLIPSDETLSRKARRVLAKHGPDALAAYQASVGQGAVPGPPTASVLAGGRSLVTPPTGIERLPATPVPPAMPGSTSAPSARAPVAGQTPPILDRSVFPPVQPLSVEELKRRVLNAHASVDSQSGGVASAYDTIG